MENASKALLLAGAVLLMVLILSFMTYLFKRTSEDSSEMYELIKESDISEFNQKFFAYDGRGTTTDEHGDPINPLNIQDVISIINLAKASNEKGRMEITVTVALDGEEMQDTTIERHRELLKNNLDKKYACSVNYSDIDIRLVGSVTITSIN